MSRETTTSASLFGCNTYAFMLSEPVESCLARMADAGFQEFEFMVHPVHLWPADMSAAQRSALRQSIDGRGLQLTALNLPNIDINLASTTPEMRAYTLNILAGTVRLAGELGARGVIISPGKASPLFAAPEEELFGYFFAALDQLCPIAASSGTALWLENVPTTWIPTVGGLMAALKRYGSDAVRMIYDVANAHFIGEDIADGLKQCRARLELVHFSDTGQKIFRHDPIGLGTVPFAALPKALAAVGYTARPMLEIISRDADRDILASADSLAALGFKRAD